MLKMPIFSKKLPKTEISSVISLRLICIGKRWVTFLITLCQHKPTSGKNTWKNQQFGDTGFLKMLKMPIFSKKLPKIEISSLIFSKLICIGKRWVTFLSTLCQHKPTSGKINWKNQQFGDTGCLKMLKMPIFSKKLPKIEISSLIFSKLICIGKRWVTFLSTLCQHKPTSGKINWKNQQFGDTGCLKMLKMPIFPKKLPKIEISSVIFLKLICIGKRWSIVLSTLWHHKPRPGKKT